MEVKRKIASLLIITSICSLYSASVFAADAGWVQEGGSWYYKNNKGENVTNAWKDNDSKTHKFYLGDDGKMLVDELFDIDDTWYYVNEDGAQIRNEWRFLDYNGEERWYYFDSNGKAYKDGWKTVGEKKYHFTDSTMDSGFLAEDGEMLEDETDVWKEATYYVGENTDGRQRVDEWVEVEDFDGSEYEDYDKLWLYFGSNGKKYKSCVKKIGNVRYAFDEAGAMVHEWYGTATPTDATYKYYDTQTGEQKSGGWFKAVPSEEQDADAHEEGEEKYFYANKSGVIYKDGIKTIGGKKYIFDQYGIMRTGMIVVDSNKKIVEILSDGENDYPSQQEISDARSKGDLILTDERGALRTGKVTVDLDGSKYTMKFNKSGIAQHGAGDGYLYDNGVLIKVDREESEDKYMTYVLDGKTYLVDTSGRIKKPGTYKDGDIVWEVVDAGDGGYKVTKKASD